MVERHLKPSPGVLGIASILQTVLVALHKELQAESEIKEMERKEESGREGGREGGRVEERVEEWREWKEQRGR